MTERFEVQRTIAAPAADVFGVLRSPEGHVQIDSSGMLQSADGSPVEKVGDEFVVHMDREALGDIPWTTYDVTVHITAFAPDIEIAWTVLGRMDPPIGHVYGYRLAPSGDDATVVTSYYDWSAIHDHWRGKVSFPILSETHLKATLGILDRTVRRGYVRG